MYAALSWERDWSPNAIETLRLRTTATIFSTSLSFPRLANSSKSIVTGTGSEPPCSTSAFLHRMFVVCQSMIEKRNE